MIDLFHSFYSGAEKLHDMMEEHWQRLFALKDHVGLLGDTGRRLGSLKDLLSMSV